MRWSGLVVALLIGAGAHASAQQAPGPTVVPRAAITWRAGRNGIASAVLEGQPSVEGAPYTLALRLDDGAWIPPHWHIKDKRILVVEGTLLFGTGETIDTAGLRELAPGSFTLVPADVRHYEGGRGQTVIILYGLGPLVTNYVRHE